MALCCQSHEFKPAGQASSEGEAVDKLEIRDLAVSQSSGRAATVATHTPPIQQTATANTVLGVIPLETLLLTIKSPPPLHHQLF